MKQVLSSLFYKDIRSHFSMPKNIFTRDQLLINGSTLVAQESLYFCARDYKIFDSRLIPYSLDSFLPHELINASGTTSSGFAIFENTALVGKETYALYQDRLILDSCQGRIGYPLYRGDVRSLLLRNLYPCEASFDAAFSVVHSLCTNYFHFLIETLPLISSVKAAFSLHNNLQLIGSIVCFVPPKRPNFIDFWINAALGELALSVPWAFKKVNISSFLAPTLPYYILSKEVIPMWGIQRYMDSSLAYVRKLGHSICANIKNNILPKKIFISRRGSSRIIANNTDVENLLQKNNYVKVLLEDLEIPDQIALFLGSTHIICLHGAGMANLVFANQIQIIELFPVSRRSEMLHFYAQLSTWIDAKHFVLMCESDQDENITVNLKSLKELL